MIHPITIFTILAALYTAAVIDYRTRTIPIWLFPCVAVLTPTICLLLNIRIAWLDCITALFIAILVYTIIALFFNGGGGDILMMAAIGWCLGMRALVCIVFISSIISLFWTIVYAHRHQLSLSSATIPYAPCVAVSTTIYFIGLGIIN